MILMGMLEGDIVHESDMIQICEANDEEMWSDTYAGIMLMNCDRGDYLEDGDTYATVYHPFTGEKLGEINAKGSGIVLNSGLVWPVVGQGAWLGVLGEVVEEISLEDFDLTW
jgi:predicted deacylase